MNGPTYYSLLDVEEDIAADELKRVIRRVLRETHPDMNGGRRSQRYVDAQKASEILLDPVLRSEYDRSIGIVHSVHEPQGSAGAEDSRSSHGDSHRTRDEYDWRFGDGEVGEAGGGDAPRRWRFRPRRVHSDVSFIIPEPRFNVALGTAEVIPHPEDDAVASEPAVNRLAVWGCFLVVLIGLFLIVWTFIPRSWIMVPEGGFDLFLFYVGRIIRVIGIAVMMTSTLAMLGGGSTLSSLMVAFVLGTPITWTSQGELEGTGMFAMSAILLVIGISVASSRRKSGTRTEQPTVPYEVVAEYNTYGEPGFGLSASGFGSDQVRAGKIGEWATANCLASLYLFPGAKIFHSLRFNARSDADVDHAVMYGNKIALIDSKLWPTSAYVFCDDGSGNLEEYNHRNPEPRVRELRMTAALTAYQEYFPDCEVRAWILIHPAADVPGFDYSNDGSPEGLRIGGADLVVNEIGSWFESTGGIPPVDRVRTWALLSLVKH